MFVEARGPWRPSLLSGTYIYESRWVYQNIEKKWSLQLDTILFPELYCSSAGARSLTHLAGQPD